MKTYGFEKALKDMKKHDTEWTRKQFRDTCKIRIQWPNSNSMNTEPYLMMVKRNTPDSDGVHQAAKFRIFPVDLSCESLLADDWYPASW